MISGLRVRKNFHDLRGRCEMYLFYIYPSESVDISTINLIQSTLNLKQS